LGFVLCHDCIQSFRPVEPASTCPRCGRWVGQRLVCGECMGQKKGFQTGYYGFYFEGRLRDAVHAFKFNGRKDVGKYIVSLLLERIRGLSDLFDSIVPMPVTERRLRERGFNQSYIIAEEIHKKTFKPVLHSVLRKVKETKDQYTLSKEERKKNVRGAFSVTDVGAIKGRRVLLVDDLFTTGHTATEGSQTLSRSGAKDVLFFAMARTP
jgi:ComF family protein